jgi:hypothetical protein
MELRRTVNGAMAGAVAAGVWAAQQPLDKRVFDSDYDDVELLGKLAVYDDYEGKLEATTPYQSFTVFITAEENPTPESPSGTEILRADLT